MSFLGIFTISPLQRPRGISQNVSGLYFVRKAAGCKNHMFAQLYYLGRAKVFSSVATDFGPSTIRYILITMLFNYLFIFFFRSLRRNYPLIFPYKTLFKTVWSSNLYSILQRTTKAKKFANLREIHSIFIVLFRLFLFTTNNHLNASNS